ncbi:MAG: hypothetical protein FJW32_14275 [Acidobacteria bacterium]|nr:hypothetical protein [Acidobacteriota bacterium]
MNIYQRFAARLAGDAEYLSHPHDESFHWLAGDWEWELSIVEPARTATGLMTFAAAPYGISARRPGCEAAPFLVYDRYSERWALVMGEPESYGALVAARGETVFEGEMTFMGVTMRLRQSWEWGEEHEVLLRNEEWIDGGWVLVDELRYRRVG